MRLLVWTCARASFCKGPALEKNYARLGTVDRQLLSKLILSKYIETYYIAYASTSRYSSTFGSCTLQAWFGSAVPRRRWALPSKRHVTSMRAVMGSTFYMSLQCQSSSKVGSRPASSSCAPVDKIAGHCACRRSCRGRSFPSLQCTKMTKFEPLFKDLLTDTVNAVQRETSPAVEVSAQGWSEYHAEYHPHELNVSSTVSAPLVRPARAPVLSRFVGSSTYKEDYLSLIHISEPTRPY